LTSAIFSAALRAARAVLCNHHQEEQEKDFNLIPLHGRNVIDIERKEFCLSTAAMGVMLQTPSTSHISFDNIYEPAEDSFLLLDTIGSLEESGFLQKRFPSHVSAPLVVEFGTGSGVVIAFVAAHSRKIFSHNNVVTLGVDLNRKACIATAATVKSARKDFSYAPGPQHSAASFLDTVQADLGSPLRNGSVDVLIFNPPYVPTEESPAEIRSLVDKDEQDPVSKSAKFEADSRLLALSYAGGVDGMETTDHFLEDLPRVLNPTRGIAYLLLCAGNKPDTVLEHIRSWGPGWDVVVAGHSGKKAGRETLQILRIWRTAEETG
jgi:release factor glutamine methyltransferase